MAAMGDLRLCWWTLTAALAILVASSGAAGVEGVCSRMHYAYAYFLSTFRGSSSFWRLFSCCQRFNGYCAPGLLGERD
jgi:hypothetical protein